jgi:hypothetical protein
LLPIVAEPLQHAREGVAVLCRPAGQDGVHVLVLCPGDALGELFTGA